MRAFVKKEANILRVPDDFATLETFTKEGKFRYRIRYAVDPVKAARSKAFKVRLLVAKKPLNKRQVRSLTNNNPDAVVKKLQTRSAAQKDAVRAAKRDIILSFTSDISSRVPNNKTTEISAAEFLEPPKIRKVFEVKAAKVSDLEAKNVSMPILERNINTSDDSDTPIAPGKLKKAASSLLFTSRRDPAVATASRAGTIVPAKKGVAGVGTKPSPEITSKLRNARVLAGSALNKSKLSNQLQLSETDALNVLTKRDARTIELEEVIDIPAGDLGENEIWLAFQLQNDKELEIQSESRSVPHGKNVSQLRIPVKAPKLVATPVGRLGRNVLMLKQLDENATAINLYRRVIKKNKENNSSEYKLVATKEAEFDGPEVKVTDRFASLDPIMYRAIPANNSGILGAEFTSVVVEQEQQAVRREKFKRRPYFASLASEVTERSIFITVRGLPPEPIGFQLFRRNKTINQKEASRVGSFRRLDADTDAPIRVEDKGVQSNRIYEYFLELLYPDGSTEVSANNILVEFTPITSNILQLEASDPNVVQDGADIDVRFTVSKNVIQTEGDQIKTFLSQQGLLAEFQDELTANRDKLQDLFAVRVIRTNITTGEVEDFGILDSDEFSDKRAGRVKSVEPLKPGFEYEYTLTAHARDPETLFETLEKTTTDSAGTDYTFKPSEWLHPVTLSDGNLVSNRSLARNHSKTQFTFGTVVDVQNIPVSLATVLPSLYDGKATRFGRNSALVQWKVQGNVNKIDHFIVILEILGMRSVVGKSHNITNSNFFQFVDRLTDNESGRLRYVVVPVYFDYSRGPELQTNSVLV